MLISLIYCHFGGVVYLAKPVPDLVSLASLVEPIISITPWGFSLIWSARYQFPGAAAILLEGQ